MNVLHTKTLLYAYPHLLEIAEQIDKLVEKKALSSLSNCLPAMTQYDEIITMTFEKGVLYVLKKECDKILSKFTEEELKYFEYKYFRRKPKSYFLGFETQTRAYFRKQVSLASKFSKRLEKAGIDDKFFTEKCLSIEFFRLLLKRTEEREKIACKNIARAEKVL